MPLNNSQYNAIMRIYDERQFRHQHAREERQRRIWQEIPEIPAIEQEIRTQALAAARRVLDGDEQAKERIKEILTDLREQKTLLLARHGYGADALEMTYDCPVCRDTGFIQGRKCRCFQKEEIRLLYAQSNIQEVLKRENFDHFSLDCFDDRERIPELGLTVRDYMKQILSLCLNYTENFGEKKGNILFTGGTGTGKTFLSNCIARELIDRYYSVIYLSAVELFELISRKKFHREEEDGEPEWTPYIYECDLLIIDDLGTELNNSFVSSQLFSTINERLLRKKGTIISTNLSLNNLRDCYSDRISSRIIRNYMTIPLYGADLRTKN